MSLIAGRIGIQQRVLPSYRAPFFEALAAACAGGLEVFAGQPRAVEAIETRDRLAGAELRPARNIHLFNGKAYLCWQSGLLEWLETWQPEVLIVEANPRYLSTPRAVQWMHRHGRPVIGWGLGAPGGGGWRGRLRGRFLAQFDAMLTYSRQGAQEYRAAGLAPERVFVAPNAAAAKPAHALPERPSELTPGDAVVLFVGRLQARKRVDALLRACAAQPEGARPRLWIVGDGPAREELEQLAGQIYPQAQFFGARHGPDLEPLFRGADLFVLPGTGGLAVQQAMAYGLPVMAGEADGTQSDLVRPGNGWQLPPGNEAALTHTLGEALCDPARLRAMGRESYRIASEEINLERMVAVFAEAIRVCTS